MKHKTPNVTKPSIERRSVLKSVALSGAGLSVLPSAWTKPIINSVLLPVHAQTTTMPTPTPPPPPPPPPPVECPMLTIGNGTFSAGSAAGTCGLSFELLSDDAATPVDIISIMNTAPVGTDAVTYSSGTSGSVTAASGLSVNWLGQAVGAPFACGPGGSVDPINEITFTVTYNCASNPDVQTMTFSLQAIAATL